MKKTPEFLEQLRELAWTYILECEANTKTHVAGSGKQVEVKDRHIPTIDYFLRIWIPKQKNQDTINRCTWYRWLNGEGEAHETINDINEIFKALASDIVANEGKGIFYAKNRLGMHDKQHLETKNVDKFDFDS